MKTFADLNFRDHQTGTGTQGLCFFENGYGVSVVRFKVMGGFSSYTSNENEWELAVLTGNVDDYDLCYSTHITDDVMGHLSEEEVTDVMRQVQELAPITIK